MTCRTVLTTITLAALATVASAQDTRFEVSGTLGYTYSDGVGGSAEDRFGNEFARIDPDDAFSWNLRAAYLVNPNVEFGALFGVQSSNLGVSIRTSAVTAADGFTLGDETLYNYHGYFAYNFGESTQLRPYVLIGLGATHFGAVTVSQSVIPTVDGQPREIGGNTKFSTTWAAGVKFFPGKNFGLRLEGRWTPTYIKTDAEGWWCDPYWGCYTAGDSQYANQYELGGGVAVRF